MKKNNQTFLKVFLSIIFLLPSLAFAQSDVEMADTFRQEGKIYVVIAVMGIILLGLLIYLIFIDRKITKIEKRIKNNS